MQCRFCWGLKSRAGLIRDQWFWTIFGNRLNNLIILMNLSLIRSRSMSLGLDIQKMTNCASASIERRLIRFQEWQANL